MEPMLAELSVHVYEFSKSGGFGFTSFASQDILNATDPNIERVLGFANAVEQVEPNWPRTFARRGISYADYDYVGGLFDDRDAVYAFTEKPKVASSRPATQRFCRDLTAKGALQGEVIVSHAMTCRFFARHRGVISSLKLRPESAPALAGRKSLTGVLDIYNLGQALTPESNQRFTEHMLAHWNARKSFVTLAWK